MLVTRTLMPVALTTQQKQRIVDLVYGGHPIEEVANLMGLQGNDVRATVQDLTQKATGQSAPATLNQRAIDLTYGGHPVAEVANLTGLAENAVRTLLQNTANAPTPASSGASAAAVASVVSATAKQDATGRPSTIYVAITGGASGTVAVAIGPTNATANAIIPAQDATLNRNVVFRLPAGWWFKVTVAGSAAIASVQQVTE